jgi:hypothetical protein
MLGTRIMFANDAAKRLGQFCLGKAPRISGVCSRFAIGNHKSKIQHRSGPRSSTDRTEVSIRAGVLRRKSQVAGQL